MALSSVIGLISKLHGSKQTSGNQSHTKIVERLEMNLQEKRQPISNDTYQLKKPSQPRVSSRFTDDWALVSASDPDSPVLSRPQEDADSYDFIIKEPDQDLIDDTEKFVNRFLRRVWSASNQPNTQQQPLPGELLPPLIYHRHQVNNDIDGSVHVTVAIKLRDPICGDFTTEVATLCDYLHSPKGRKEQLCKEISDWDIFGLEPVPRTTFLICWDSAFLYNLLVNTIPTVQSTLEGLKRVKAAAAKVKWVRIGCFLFTYYCTPRNKKPGTPRDEKPGLLDLVKTGVAGIMGPGGMPTDELQRQIYFIGEMVGEILHLLASFLPKIITVTPIEWKCEVRRAKGKLDDVCRTLQLGAASAVDVTDLTFMKESFFTYRDALDCFSYVLVCNEDIWTMYSRGIMKWTFATATSARYAGVALYSIRGVAQRAAMTWAPFVGTVAGAAAAVAATAYSGREAYRSREKVNWCKQVDTCLRVCSDSVRDCEQLTGYLHLFHNRGQESLFYRNSSEEDMVEGFLNEIQEKTGKDPRQADFITGGGYRAILQDRRGALQNAIAEHEGIFTKISTMSI